MLNIFFVMVEFQFNNDKDKNRNDRRIQGTCDPD